MSSQRSLTASDWGDAVPAQCLIVQCHVVDLVPFHDASSFRMLTVMPFEPHTYFIVPGTAGRKADAE